MPLIICMAGLNTRFHDSGFDIPKYLLPFGEGKTVISTILDNLCSNYRNDVLLLANKRDIHFKNQLMKTIGDVGFSSVQYIGDTLGQAHTAAIGASFFDEWYEPFHIHNADTILYNRDITGYNLNNKIDCFKATSPKYCYIEHENNKAINISEKEVISESASSGLYTFESSGHYLRHFLNTEWESGKEMYISTVYKTLLFDQEISVELFPDSKDTVVLGNPKEYIEALKNASA